jgi:hypothetical protein
MKHSHAPSRRQPLLRFIAQYATLLLLCLVALAVTGCDGRQAATPGKLAAQGPVQPETQPPAPAPLQARQTYRNVPLLGELDSAEFDRTMRALTAWVAPQAGCSHCHVDGDAASDAKPAKATARRMLQMVQHINTNWKPHVGRAGVTCQTCHQGQPRPVAAQAVVDAPAGRAAAVGAGQPLANAGVRMLQEINGDFLAGGTPAGCGSCHAAGSAPPAAHHEAARPLLALLLPPTESAAPAVTAAQARPETCPQAARAAVKAGTRLTLAQALRPVVGGDALTLYAAPDAGCAMLDLHLQAGDTVEAFVAHAGYTSVRYRREATGSEARGWVRSERLGPALETPALGTLSPMPPARVPAAAAAATVATLTAALPASCNLAAESPAAPEPLRGRARVLGQGRLQFFAVPNASCPLRGIFILPGEPVETLQRAAGFIAVAYVNPRTGGRATGWVTAARVGLTGEGSAPLLR